MTVRRFLLVTALHAIAHASSAAQDAAQTWQIWLDIAKNYGAPLGALIGMLAWRAHSKFATSKKDAASALEAEEAAIDRKRARFDQAIETYAEMLVERAERAEMKQLEAEKALRAEKKAREKLEATVRHLTQQTGHAAQILDQQDITVARHDANVAHEQAAAAIGEARELTAETKRGIAALPEEVRGAHADEHDGEHQDDAPPETAPPETAPPETAPPASQPDDAAPQTGPAPETAPDMGGTS